MNKAQKGDWVQIQRVVLTKGSRAPQVPTDTQECDLLLWVKGIAQSEASLGDDVEIVTVTGRKTSGKLFAIHPGYTHSYGRYVPQLTKIQLQLQELMDGGEGNE